MRSRAWRSSSGGGVAMLEPRDRQAAAAAAAALYPICLVTMETGSAFADEPVRLLPIHRVPGLDLDTDALRLAAHLFGVVAGHRGAEVVEYCPERLQECVSSLA